MLRQSMVKAFSRCLWSEDQNLLRAVGTVRNLWTIEQGRKHRYYLVTENKFCSQSVHFFFIFIRTVSKGQRASDLLKNCGPFKDHLRLIRSKKLLINIDDIKIK